jgi:hypothetical protein
MLAIGRIRPMLHASVTVAAVVLALTPFAVQPAPNFSGTWTMDESRSVSATQEAFVSPVVWTIQHDERLVVVDIQRGPKQFTLKFAVLASAPTAPPDEVPTARAFWNEDHLITELAQNVQGQTMTTREEWSLQAGGRELQIERLVRVEHGYTMKGARSYNTAKDIFVKKVR